MEVDSEPPSGDTLNLFTSQSSPAPAPDAPVASASLSVGSPLTELEEDALTATSYVEVPKLSEEALATYQRIPGGWEAADEQAEDEVRIVELVGEYTYQDKRYLYARHGDGILRKVSKHIQYVYICCCELIYWSSEGGLGIQDVVSEPLRGLWCAALS